MKDITITIKYKLSHSEEWYIVDFLPNEYFDLEPNEQIEWDCVPFHNDR